MVDFSLRRTTQLGFALLVAALVAGSAVKARAVVLAYEGFNYTAGTKIVDANNDGIYDDGLGSAGGGWAGAWDNLQGVTPDASSILAGSLGYTDALGNVLTTAGGRLMNTGVDGSSRPGRSLAARRDGPTLGATATTPVSTWVSFLAIRTGGLNATVSGTPAQMATGDNFRGGANFSLFDNDVNAGIVNEEKLNFGENSNFQKPLVTGDDLLRLQREAVVDSAQIDLWKQKYGRTSTLAENGYDFWMLNAPRAQTGITAQAAPSYVDPQDGTITAAIDWYKNPINGRFGTQMTDVPFGVQVDLMLARIDHYGGDAPRDKVFMWMNPNLNAAPSDANADASVDMAFIEARGLEQTTQITPAFSGVEGNKFSFDRVLLFARNNATPPFAELQLDEIRIGEAFADVTPHAVAIAAVPEPGSLALAAAALVAVRGLRRRK